MIADVQVCSVLEGQFPELELGNYNRTFYAYLDRLSVHMRERIEARDIGQIEQCFLLVNKLYHHSSAKVRNAIENIFIYRIIHPLQQSRARFEIKRVMPDTLRELVYRQLYNAAI